MSVAFWCLRQSASRPFASASIASSRSSWTTRSTGCSTMERCYSSAIAKTSRGKKEGVHRRQPKEPNRPTSGVIHELQTAKSQPHNSDPIRRLLQSTNRGAKSPEAPRSRTLQSSLNAFQELRNKHPGPAKVLHTFLTRDAPYVYKAPNQSGLVVVLLLVSSFTIGASLIFISLGTTMPEGISQIATRSYLIVAGFFLLATAFCLRTPRNFIKTIKVVEHNERIYLEALVKPYLYLPGKLKTTLIDPLKLSASQPISSVSMKYEQGKRRQSLDQPDKGDSLVQRTKYTFERAFNVAHDNFIVFFFRDGLININEKGGKHVGRLDARGWFPADLSNGLLLDILASSNRDPS